MPPHKQNRMLPLQPGNHTLHVHVLYSLDQMLLSISHDSRIQWNLQIVDTLGTLMMSLNSEVEPSTEVELKIRIK